MTLRLRILDSAAVNGVFLRLLPSDIELPLRAAEAEGELRWYQLCLRCGSGAAAYRFTVDTAFGRIICDRCGARADDGSNACSAPFRLLPGFRLPKWALGAVEYQIFPDRFCNGDPDNDVLDHEYFYQDDHVRRITDWNRPPETDDNRCFYGGDLRGIINKLDYLQQLGIEVLYLNPIFVSPSPHKYDTQDYRHIDPHLGVIVDDIDHPLQEWEHHNGYAAQYIRRTLSPRNLEASDLLFAELCQELHRRGMRIILDGVFNHCGSFHYWFDREGIYLDKYGYQRGAAQTDDSCYRDHFRPDAAAETGWESWWGQPTLPKLDYESSQALREEIFSAVEKWSSPPYSVDGWRLDVAADLGHSSEFNHHFWREFRRRIKAVSSDILILAEHYGDPLPWLDGSQWDSVMNYDAFFDPVSLFFTGMEKHSDRRYEEKHLNGKSCIEELLLRSSRLPWQSLLCAMNQLSNHDHSRFLTRTNGHCGRLSDLGSAAAAEGISKAVFRAAVLMQMSWPGAPTVYYADEAGQVGWTDPDNRRTYPWGMEDAELIELHREAIRLHRSIPALRGGSVKPLTADGGTIAYARFTADSQAVAAFNLQRKEQSLLISVRSLGMKDGDQLALKLLTDSNGHSCDIGTVRCEHGAIELHMPPESAALLIGSR